MLLDKTPDEYFTEIFVEIMKKIKNKQKKINKVLVMIQIIAPYKSKPEENKAGAKEKP